MDHRRKQDIRRRVLLRHAFFMYIKVQVEAYYIRVCIELDTYRTRRCVELQYWSSGFRGPFVLFVVLAGDVINPTVVVRVWYLWCALLSKYRTAMR